MTVEKKYFSIAEVAEFTGLTTHKLRYVEKLDQNLSIIKMRGRRYYTKDSINYLKKNYSINSGADDYISIELDKVDSAVKRSESTFVVEGTSPQTGLGSNANPSDNYKTTHPHQLDLGIKSSSTNSSAEQESNEAIHLNSINKNTNQVAKSTAQIFTEIEFQQISIISRIDQLLNKLYKLVDKANNLSLK